MALSFLHSADTIAKRHVADHTAAGQQWKCNQAASDQLSKPYADGSMGEWMRACPTTPMLELSDEEVLWGWRSRFGRPGLHTPTHCAKILPSGLACCACLDVAGVRYGTCARQLFLKRHHGIARLLQDLARASGATTAREHCMPCAPHPHSRPQHC